jgi:hypothetical protein
MISELPKLNLKRSSLHQESGGVSGLAQQHPCEGKPPALTAECDKRGYCQNRTSMDVLLCCKENYPLVLNPF